MANELRLKLIGYSAFEAESIASVMFLAERRLAKPWRIVKTPAADFYLLPETLIPDMRTDERLKNLPPERCIFTVQEHHDNAPQLEILADVHNVPRLHELAARLNHLSSAETLTEFTIADPQAGQKTGGKPKFIPAKGFLGCLLAHRNRQNLQLTIALKTQPAQETLYIYPAAQIFYSRTGFEQLLPFFSAEDHELQVETKPVNHEALKDLAGAENFRPYSLGSLIWYTAFKISQGRLLDGTQARAVVKLTHWPDITLPGCRELMKLAAFMHNNAADLQTFADKLGLPIETVIDFYNACAVAGIIELRSQVDLHNKRLPTEKSTLLAKIQSRLNKEIAT